MCPIFNWYFCNELVTLSPQVVKLVTTTYSTSLLGLSDPL